MAAHLVDLRDLDVLIDKLPWRCGIDIRDALVALAKTKLAERASSADIYQVVVHVDADALRGSAEPRDTAAPASPRTVPRNRRLADGTPLPLSAARRLACDASIVRLLGRAGAPLDLGRKARTISPSLRRALYMRDQTCQFPGCTQRHHTDAHHLKHWADGGETNLENLLRLCRFHHMLVHERRLRRPSHAARRVQVLRPETATSSHKRRASSAATARHFAVRTTCVVSPRALSRSGQRTTVGENVDLGWTTGALLESRAGPNSSVE
jgi:Domain of unknown function (DUF222)